ncbi:MAG: hypothetical protein IIZ40_01780 [Bacilli bacterium]|nr:hypothetical protein [Bacilli bacterium]
MKKIITVLILLLEVFLIIYSKEITKEFILTLKIFMYNLMPILFFQLTITELLKNLNLYKIIPSKIEKIFSLTKNEALIILLSMLSGYPNNIKLLKDKNNEYLNYISNYINPLFIITVVSKVYLKNIKIGLIILLSHIISNLILMYLLRSKYTKTKEEHDYNLSISNTLNNTCNALKIILTNLLFISIFITLLKLTIPINNIIKAFLIGLVEFSRGIYEISLLNISIYLKGLLITIIITFQSLSIHFQIISINEKIKYIKFLLYRLLNVLLSIIIYFILVFLMYKI